MLLTSMSEHKEAKKVNKELEDSQVNVENNQRLLQNMNIPTEFSGIQQRATQVWNCD